MAAAPISPTQLSPAATLAGAAAPAPAKTGNPEAARKAAEEFEAFFVSQMLEHMYVGLEADPLFGGGEGEQVFRSMMVQEYGRTIARGRGIGIADAVQQEILRMQESN